MTSPKANLIARAKLISEYIKYSSKEIQKFEKELDFEDLVMKYGKPWIEFQLLMNHLFILRSEQITKQFSKVPSKKKKLTKKKSTKKPVTFSFGSPKSGRPMR